MKSKLIALVVSMIALGGIAPVKAAETLAIDQTTTAQAAPTARQVLEACVQNRAETLPNPYVDVSPNHWAYKAVLTMHYCGAFRQATPQSLIDRLTNETNSQQSQRQMDRNLSAY